MYKLFNKKLKNSIVINVAMSLINNKYHFHLFLILNGIWHISEVPLMPSDHQIKNLKKTFAKKLCFRRGLDFFISFGRLLIQLDKKTKQNGKKLFQKFCLVEHGSVWQKFEISEKFPKFWQALWNSFNFWRKYIPLSPIHGPPLISIPKYLQLEAFQR